MSLIRPFKGLRPKKGMAAEIASPPYDVMDSKEARKMAEGREHSFLHVVKPEIEYYVEWVKDYHELHIQDKNVKRGKTQIILSHYAHKVWNKSHWGSWMLYGHSHGSLPEDDKSLSIDVGVDAVAKRYAVDGVINPQDYRPICYEEIKVIMESKQFTPIDHHKDSE